MEPIRPIEILLIEDNPNDVELTRQTLKRGKVLNNLSVIQDGHEAMNYLRRMGKYESATRPDLILLDLNLPKKDGREVLEEIKGDESLRAIPVVVLTTSNRVEDVLRSYNKHANCYLVKPVEWEEFTKLVKSIEDFWISIVKLPNEE